MSKIRFVVTTVGKADGTSALRLPKAMQRLDARVDDLLLKDGKVAVNWENNNWPKKQQWMTPDQAMNVISQRMRKAARAKNPGVDAFVRGARGAKGPTHKIKVVEVGTSVSVPSYASPELSRLIEDVWEHFGSRGVQNWGMFNCRHIAGSSSWSQHAYLPGKAIDLGVGANRALGDDIARYIRANAGQYGGLCELLWEVPDHYDHIHVVVGECRSGTPACA